MRNNYINEQKEKGTKKQNCLEENKRFVIF